MGRLTWGVVIAALLLGGAALAWAGLRTESGRRAAGWLYAQWRGITIDYGARIPMADGLTLAADVYVPDRGRGKVPTVLLRTPYPRDQWMGARSEVMHFAMRGYAVVVQSMRGRFGSEGEFSPYGDSVQDGAATLDWIAAQPWSNGRVGTYGCSALGESQLILAAGQHPALRAMIPQSAGGGVGSAGQRYGYFGVFEGGIPLLSSAAGWFFSSGAKTSAVSMHQDTQPPKGEGPDGALSLTGLPSIDLVRRQSPYATDYEWLMRTPLNDAGWATLGYLKDGDRLSAPALHINSWFDQGVSATIFSAQFMSRNADNAQAAANQPVIIGPGTHCSAGLNKPVDSVGDLPVSGPSMKLFDTYADWFDRWLKDVASTAKLPAFRFYVMGEDRWLDSGEWPPSQARDQRYYLDSGGNANTRNGDGELAASPPTRHAVDHFEYDPRNPVPTRGGTFCCTGDGLAREGSVDQQDIETRKDVLVYTSAPLTRATRITGAVIARLHVATSGRDTDFTARLVDVSPEGLALNIRDGGLRLRYRDGIDRPALAVPGRTYPITIELGDIAWQVPAGHRLRSQIASSNFPCFERNLNTGGRNFDETQSVTVINDLLHGPEYSGWLQFPVLQ